MHIIIDIIILIVTIVVGIPVPFCFMAAALYMGIVAFPDFSFLMTVGFRALNSLTLLSIPFFIIAGMLMSSSGIAERLTSFADSVLGRMKGGLGAATIWACAIFGAISGTASSAVAAIGTIMIPKLEERGYPRYYSTAMVSCSAILGQLIPPSVPMILYGWVTQTSVTACFLATILPGIAMATIYSLINFYMVKRNFPTVAVEPPAPGFEKVKIVARATKRSIWSLLMPVIILGAIYGGATTPTEAAAVAVTYSIIIGFFVYKELNIKSFFDSLTSAATTSGVIILMLFFVTILGRLYTMQRVPMIIADFLLSISDNKIVILLMVNVFLIIIGMLMDDLSGTMLVAPLLLPLMMRIGVHPVHFAAILGTNLGLGNVTPPTAPILYLGGRIGKVQFNEYIPTALVFMILGNLPIIILTTYVPWFSMFLPRLIMGVK
ncbi:TRAP transporter, DctM subunit [Acetomicrobium thermoterrenum DSM 13490]|jgi:tripartite ATP-independent transporter DctM subunit|uniref:TRAP transporter, DctM subunit n=1 Tax=Acetomicrobium thermoterrenum DSM 13490 TaxID=1120987 RepID=A0A1H3HGS4_9BACT|nr:TRAP transporter large permease [Acetomicrobium thermoterrenum]SDY14763.1 TRAP transporter, DctM subunit [Acetomicrobium thermoterrenum DSM 13490]